MKWIIYGLLLIGYLVYKVVLAKAKRDADMGNVQPSPGDFSAPNETADSIDELLRHFKQKMEEEESLCQDSPTQDLSVPHLHTVMAEDVPSELLKTAPMAFLAEEEEQRTVIDMKENASIQLSDEKKITKEDLRRAIVLDAIFKRPEF